jgi:hypothetical protein
MSVGEVVLENLDRAPCWPRVRMELSLLFADLINDPRYSERVMHIEELLADPQFPKAEQIYFVPK